MKKIVVLIYLVLLTLTPSLVKAQDGHFTLDPTGLGVPAPAGGNAEATVQTIIVNVVAIFFTIGGLGVVVYFVWGAVDWILSGGDKEKISNARKKMTNAIIGLVLLSMSYVIINLIGQIVQFNPLGALQIPGLGYTGGRPTQGP